MSLNLNPKRVKKNKRPKVVGNHLRRSQRRINQPHIIQDILRDDEVMDEWQEKATQQENVIYLDDFTDE